MSSIDLSQIDPEHTGPYHLEAAAQEELNLNINKLKKLQQKLFASHQHAILIILQGMDTSGKDSLIKHAFNGINPQGCSVESFKPPEPHELAHGYMWRYINLLPIRGMITIFNRSYYEETTTVRVHPEFLKLRDLNESPNLWQNRYKEFNYFEHYLSNNNINIIKIFLHISKQEQLKRLKKRIETPDKHWKFDISDIREREHWDSYMKYFQETISHTHTKYAPWHVIPSNHKWHARLRFSQILVKYLEDLKLSFPKITGDKKAAIERARQELSRVNT